MNLSLRFVAAHPRAGTSGGDDVKQSETEYALSSRTSSILLARDAVLVQQSTSTTGVICCLRAASTVEKLVYCGGAGTFIAFLENRTLAAYAEGPTGVVEFVSFRDIPGDDRPVSFAAGSHTKSFVVFTKTESPSVYCAYVDSQAGVSDIVKLRGDIQGNQEKVGVLDAGLAMLRGKVATKAKDRISSVVAVDAHPNKHLAAAAYENGILRVWEVMQKELRSQFDAQLLLRESIVDIALHPDYDVLVACTDQGRIMVFQIRGIAFNKAEQPQLAISKMRDRSRRYRAVCCLPGRPTYVMFLTASRRVFVRLLNDAGQLVASKRYSKLSRPLPISPDSTLPSSTKSDNIDPRQSVVLRCEPRCGLIATSVDDTGNVYIYQRLADQLSSADRAVVGAPLDTGFSHVSGKAFKGPVEIYSEGVFAQRGYLYSYAVGHDDLIQLCRLPRCGEVRRLEVARDQHGSLLAIIAFLYLDEEGGMDDAYEVSESASQYVLVTKRGDGEAWNVSEPLDGATGCFLNASGKHDRFLILSLDGKVASVRSFAGQRKTPAEQRAAPATSGNSRGVQRFNVGGRGACQVFRAPFSSWCAVVYEDRHHRRLTVSRNSFRSTAAFTGSVPAGDDDTFHMDDESSMDLIGDERVIDVRWQRLPSSSRGEQYLAAIMTTKRLYLVRDIFEFVARFEFSSVENAVVPFAVPTMCWMGPAVMIMFGQYLYAVTLDGEADFVAGMGQSENSCALAAAFPDRVIVVRPTGEDLSPSPVVSRPIGIMSILVRGMLSLPTARNNDGSYYINKLKEILLSHDTSQGSEALIDALIRNDLSPVAYILASSDHGKHSLPPLKRAAFLGRIGDLRGAMKAAEAEYARLPSADAFHNGTELFRLLQRILNMAMIAGDFAVGKRCSELLGRRGTFSAFVDSEGGYAALASLSKYAEESGYGEISSTLRPLVEKSAKSCIATDTSRMPSSSQMRNARAGIAAFDRTMIALGTEDQADILVAIPLESHPVGTSGKPKREKLEVLKAKRFIDRLEMMPREKLSILKGVEDYEDDFNIRENLQDNNILSDVPTGPAVGTIQNQFATSQGVMPVTTNVAELALAEHRPAPGNFEVSGSPSGYLRTEMAQHAQYIQATAENVDEQVTRMRQENERHIHAQMNGVPEQQANDCLRNAFMKINERRHSSALREVQRALSILSESKLTGGRASPHQVAELAHYHHALSIWRAMDTLSKTPRAQMLPGKIAMAQYTSMLSSLPLRQDHKIIALSLAVDAYLATSNFGLAAQTMEVLKTGGVPNNLRADLRRKYELCISRGFFNATQIPSMRFCWHTLRPIPHGLPVIKCSFCPAYFSFTALREEGMPPDQMCLCCNIGDLRTLQSA